MQINQGWGMTEVTCGALHVPGGIYDDSGSVGQLDPNTECMLLDDDGNEVDLGKPGEMYIRGPQVCLRYWKNDQATRESISDDKWLRTGDVAVCDDRGYFWIVDRKKELIKVNALQVAPAELEAVLLEHEHIADAAVVGITLHNEEWPRAYVAIQDHAKGKVQPGDIQEWIKSRVAKHKHLVGGVTFVEEVPKLASGKIHRKTMRECRMAPSAMPDPNGVTTNGYLNGAGYAYPNTFPQEEYRVLPQYHSKATKLRVASIGAGASGLCLAYKMERMLEAGTWELTLHEKNTHFGGTWYENTYPGVACDIPSHLYTFSWDPNPKWSHYFAYGGEIQRYFEDFAKRHGSEKYMKLNSKVVEARWNETEGKWTIILENPQTGERSEDWCHVLVNGSGILNNWRWPDIEGIHDFKGPLIHSAKWDHTVDFQDKDIGVIGTGSSSVQIVPQLQKKVKHMDVFMRSSTWISPPFGGGVLSELHGDNENAGERQYTFTDADKEKFKNDPEYLLMFRKRIESEINSLFGMYQQNSEMSNQFREVIKTEMNKRMGPGNEKLKEFIIPKWSPGCRRISPGDGYLEALVQPNVSPVFSGIKKIVPEGILTEDGEVHKMDVLVCATGFQVAFKPAFKVVADNGTTLEEDWTSGPNMYLGLSAPRFPNFYTIVGPGATWSSGTLLPSIETSVEYAVKCMRKMQKEQIRSMDVKQEALDDIYTHFDEFHKTTVWQEECRSWFKDGKIKNRIYLWPGSTIHFLKTIKDPRFEDYNIRYRYKNRFAFLGNGEVKANTQKGNVQGLSPYVRNSDHEWSIE
ncbi:putative sterigmatocystin biosynthesis monooxygenase stcW [Halenospora varia]|nr:putative sterigmatocystin biosynthesis monooxygenase stcW [Halenospora varia]